MKREQMDFPVVRAPAEAAIGQRESTDGTINEEQGAAREWASGWAAATEDIPVWPSRLLSHERLWSSLFLSRFGLALLRTRLAQFLRQSRQFRAGSP